MQTLDLPPIRKKVFYIDQFALSDMLKAVRARAGGSKKRGEQTFWLNLFERIGRLIGLQAIVCPPSLSHFEESIVSSFPDDLRRLYDGFSTGVSFHDPQYVRLLQFRTHIASCLHGSSDCGDRFEPSDITDGAVHGWSDVLAVSMRMSNTSLVEQELDDLRRKYKGMLDAFKRTWAEDKRASEFWPVYEQEVLSYSQALVSCLETGRGTRSVREMIWICCDELAQAGIRGSGAGQRLREYLSADRLRSLPFLHIASLLWASVSRKVYCGQRGLKASLVNDIDMVSTLLPYCDGMLVDNECRAHLSENPVREGVSRFNCRIFSCNVREELLAYLESIEHGIPGELREKVSEVYGHA